MGLPSANARAADKIAPTLAHAIAIFLPRSLGHCLSGMLGVSVAGIVRRSTQRCACSGLAVLGQARLCPVCLLATVHHDYSRFELGSMRQHHKTSSSSCSFSSDVLVVVRVRDANATATRSTFPNLRNHGVRLRRRLRVLESRTRTTTRTSHEDVSLARLTRTSHEHVVHRRRNR